MITMSQPQLLVQPMIDEQRRQARRAGPRVARPVRHRRFKTAATRY